MMSFNSGVSGHAKGDQDVIETTATNSITPPRPQKLPSPPSTSLSPSTADPPVSTDNETSSSQNIKTNWSSAHDAYCKKHNVLRATILQVSQEFDHHHDEVPWEMPQREAVLVDAHEVAVALRSEIVTKSDTSTAAVTRTTSAASSRSYASLLLTPVILPFNLIKSLVSAVLKDPYGYDDEEWFQEGDDAFLEDDEVEYHFEEEEYSGSFPTNPSFSESGLIVNLPLMRSVVDLLQEEINRQSSLVLHGDMPVILTRSEWNGWVSNALSKTTVALSDREFLLQVLVSMKIAKIINRKEKSSGVDLIILFPASVAPKVDMKRTNEEDDIPEFLRVPIALFDLQMAKEHTERQIHTWDEQLNECTKKALHHKSTNPRLALYFMKKRKMLATHIETKSNTLMTLEQTKATMESSYSNKQLVGILADASSVLKDMRKNASIDRIDDVMDDLQEGLDSQQEFNDTLIVTSNMATGGPIDEEELLKELEELNLDDVDETHTVDNTSTTEQDSKITFSDSSQVSSVMVASIHEGVISKESTVADNIEHKTPELSR